LFFGIAPVSPSTLLFRPLTICLLLAPTMHGAGAELSVPKKKMAAISVLPDGSELKGVVLPRYDKNRKLVGVLKAEAMTLVNEDTVSGRTVSLEFFNPDGSPRGRADLTKAEFNQAKGMLEAREPVIIQSDAISATGQGLVYDLAQGEGFLIGPVTTWAKARTETAMKSSSSPLRSAAVAVALAAQPLAAAPPSPPTDAEKAALQADTAPRAAEHAAALQAVRQDLKADLDASTKTNAAAADFLERTQLTTTETTAKPNAPAGPLDRQPGPDDTRISCDGGMYFDADEGVFVYLKNVKVDHPQFTLTADSELKIFLAKKPEQAVKNEDPAAKETKPKEDGAFAKFGEVDRIVATGAPHMKQKKIQGVDEPVEARGAIFSYNVKSGHAIISGGYPWFVRGANAMRAMEPDLSVRVDKAGNAATDGKWEMFVHIDQKR
jgi:lipopolysaccharide export system protein LptA